MTKNCAKLILKPLKCWKKLMDMLQCVRDSNWHCHFTERKAPVEIDEHLRRLSINRNTETAENVFRLVKADRRLTIRELCGELGISLKSCDNHCYWRFGDKKNSSRVCSIASDGRNFRWPWLLICWNHWRLLENHHKRWWIILNYDFETKG